MSTQIRRSLRIKHLRLIDHSQDVTDLVVQDLEAVNMDSVHIKSDFHERNVDNQYTITLELTSTSQFVVQVLHILPHPQVRIYAPTNPILRVIEPPAAREQQSLEHVFWHPFLRAPITEEVLANPASDYLHSGGPVPSV